jgi:hypothetical protein
MARIDLETLKYIDKDRNTVHIKVKTTYTVFEVDGEKYFQIDTYGKSGREMPEKISQSIQFDNESARFFSELLKKEFNL